MTKRILQLATWKHCPFTVYSLVSQFVEYLKYLLMKSTWFFPGPHVYLLIFNFIFTIWQTPVKPNPVDIIRSSRAAKCDFKIPFKSQLRKGFFGLRIKQIWYILGWLEETIHLNLLLFSDDLQTKRYIFTSQLRSLLRNCKETLRCII